MQKCIELARLPKTSGKIRSLLFRRQTPGELPQDPSFIKRENILDPSHPAVGISRRTYPSFSSADLNLTVYPFALLSQYDVRRPYTVSVESWKERVERTIQHPDFDSKNPTLLPVRVRNWHAERKRLPMSLRIIATMKSTSKKRVVRTKITNKLKTAIELVTIKGAEVKKVDGKETLVMNAEKAEKMSREGVMRGWTYIFFPRLAIYLMPYTKLVPLVEKALSVAYVQASSLERSWAIKALVQKGSPPDRKTTTPILRTGTENVSMFNRSSTSSASTRRSSCLEASVPLSKDATTSPTPSLRSPSLDVKPRSNRRQPTHAHLSETSTQPAMDLVNIFARRSEPPTRQSWQSYPAETDGNAHNEEWDPDSADEADFDVLDDDTLDSKYSSAFASVASGIVFTPPTLHSPKSQAEATQSPTHSPRSTQPPRTSRNTHEKQSKPTTNLNPPTELAAKDKMFKFEPFVLDVHSKTVRNSHNRKAGRSSSARMKVRGENRTSLSSTNGSDGDDERS
ncbi:hypothetical protein E1B28_006669 [Marasmius oreades]|uniref:Uncharacterized protein n=1 Tax=Marasmius oreades TaxID=181124 RepID=A0A9P7UWK7_9AGAR|nr:uncharacterized protein E1B28_006669 [Marasmius oreades]KAG7095986.1 hypothetical protein E1B28_006669 [Marasmius oreades]